MQQAFDLTGQSALVVGGGRGIGAAIVRRFAAAGAAVTVANRTVDVAETLAKELSDQGLCTNAVPLPALDRAALGALVNNTANQHGRLDILVHNAGGCPWSHIDDLDEDKLEQTLELNLKAAFWLTQAAAPHMRANGYGRVLVTSSVSAHLAMAGGAHYSAAKAGINAFIRGAAFEYAREGITVNGVEPGFIAKPGRGTLGKPETRSKLERHIPIGHMGDADDIACAMLYLASREAKYTTGQSLSVDGGSSLPETGFAVESYWGL